MKENTANRNSSSGMSLIEVIITIAIIGLMMGISVGFFRDRTEDQLSDLSGKLAGTVQYVYNEAVIKGHYYRLVIDFSQHTFSVESSSSPFKVGPQDEEEPVENTGAEGTGEKSEKKFSQVVSYLLKPVKLPEGIQIKDVFVEHLPQKIESGKTAIYFFPDGRVEKSVINLSDDKGESFYSLEIFPLTGKTKIRTEYFEYKPEEKK